jgi:hypothetical protein
MVSSAWSGPDVERETHMRETGMMTPEQCMKALERANAVRLARASLKRQVADGELTAAEVIRDAPWEAENLTLADLLMSQHRWGRQRCRKFLARNQINELKTVGTLTERQRRLLADQLDSCAALSVQLESCVPEMHLAAV